MTVFLCDGLFQLKPPLASTISSSSSTTVDNTFRSFFSITMRLPKELQMILCHRVVGSKKESILCLDSEAAFRALAKMLLPVSTPPSPQPPSPLPSPAPTSIRYVMGGIKQCCLSEPAIPMALSSYSSFVPFIWLRSNIFSLQFQIQLRVDFVNTTALNFFPSFLPFLPSQSNVFFPFFSFVPHLSPCNSHLLDSRT